MPLNATVSPLCQTRSRYPKAIVIAFAAMLLAPTIFAQNSASPDGSKPMATLDGQPLFETDLPNVVRAQLEKLQQQEDVIKARGLDALFEEKLVQNEAKKRGLTIAQLFAADVDGSVADPTPSEVRAYYLARQDQSGRSFDDVKDSLATTLKNAKIQQARQDYLRSLLERAKAGGEAVVLLQPRRLQIAVDSKRLKGSASAPVVIVEFSDFSCPFCHAAEATMKDLLAKYQGKVSLAYRDFPLRDIHPHAELAAEASRCASAQGHFWEYHDLLFANPQKQERDDLVAYAKTAGLDPTGFETCLDKGEFRAQIDQDIQEGSRVGVSGTPGFFINGIFVNGAQPEAKFAEIIDSELALAAGKTGGPAK